MTELRIERQLAATPERAWRAFTTADGLAAWLWPQAWGTVVELDLRVGGAYRIEAASPGLSVEGEFVSIDEPHRLVQTWRWGDDEETLVTMTFDAIESGTRLTLVHERFDSVEDRDSHLQGWNDCLDRLPAYLEG